MVNDLKQRHIQIKPNSKVYDVKFERDYCICVSKPNDSISNTYQSM